MKVSLLLNSEFKITINWNIEKEKNQDWNRLCENFQIQAVDGVIVELEQGLVFVELVELKDL